jgi:phosphoribosylamine--glycine ligase
MYNVLLIGSGAREHALAWKLSQSKLLNQLYITPGNPGTALCGINLNIPANDFDAIKKVIWEKDIDIVVVGPEDPLVNGITDNIQSDKVLKDVIVIGPNKAGAMLEGSKAFAKSFMQKYNIPTARYQSFTYTQLKEALEFLKSLQPPYVIKADGLAAGKGVVIVPTLEEAKTTVEEMFSGKFGEASQKIVIEEFLQGIEVSYFVLCNEEHFVLLPDAKDYKRIGENDTGLNTGGMGTVSPALTISTPEFTERVLNKVIRPTLEGLKAEGISYCGFIFFGLMNVNNHPYVIEYNCRLGDPETESIMLRIESDLIELFVKTAKKELTHDAIQISNDCAATVIIASKGYPEKFDKGFEIIIEQDKIQSHLFYAGTAIKDGKLVNNGGRVMAVSSLGKTLQEALNISYQSIQHIHFENMYYRRDIGQDILKRLNTV